MMQTTKAMRDRIKELATPERDDFDRAVNLLLADFEAQQALLQRARDFISDDLNTYFDADGARLKIFKNFDLEVQHTIVIECDHMLTAA